MLICRRRSNIFGRAGFLLPDVRAFLFVAALAVLASPAMAQQTSTAPIDDSDPKIHQLLELLSDPDVRSWIEQHSKANADQTAPAPTAQSETAAPAAQSEAAAAETSTASFFAARIAAIRTHLGALAAAAPTLPGALLRAAVVLSRDLKERGLFNILLLIGGFIGLGYFVEWLARRLTRNIRQRVAQAPVDTVGQRLRAIAVRVGFRVESIVAFAIGSIGAFLAFDWSSLLRETVLGYLVAFLALRMALAFSSFLLAPDDERFRVLPMSTRSARFWHRRIGLFVGWFAFGYISVELLATLGMPVETARLIAYVLGLGLLAIALESIWRRPAGETAEPAEGGDLAAPRGRGVRTWLLSAAFVFIWLLWVMGAIQMFWVAVVGIGMPLLDLAARRGVDHVFRQPDPAPGVRQTHSVVAASLARGLRVLLVVGGALLLARAWHIDLAQLTSGDSVPARLMHGAINAVIVVLAADFAWHVIRALIDRKLADSHVATSHAEEARRQSRMRTLLPILRNIIFVVLMVIAVLMALSALGVEIGPLIAGAGVIGVAIGFGAQTLVKDVISGMFYVLDDAFRVGEYIQSGNYKGTVESFSLRSVRLRHQNGPIYTVPFGELGAVQNMSRDWVIDKLTIGVTYDTDLEKAKKLIKQIGKELEQDPEFKPHMLETLKMQGVQEFGDYAIQLRLKMMTRPGQQFVIRRRAFAMIKKAFDANGIKFAYPTVQVAGGDDVTAAVAQQALAKTAPAPEAG
jgi:small-conductance mechanosensitive channel